MRLSVKLILAAAFGVAALVPSATMAKMRNGPFYERGLGCWSREESYGSRTFCFRKDGLVQGLVFNAKESEALGTNGHYQISTRRSTLYILGSPGEGWPSRNYVEQCLFSFNADGQVMTLAGCDIAGEWNRAPDHDP